jgi:hypothetical protein
MRSILAILIAAALALSCQHAEARGPFHARIGAYNKQAAVGAYGKAVYPRYRAGFHIREFENVGIPHGDMGIDGNGITRLPW